MGTGIPVPAIIPEGSKAFVLCVPDDPFFYGVVMGLLKAATFKYYWNGTEEQKTAVTDRMLVMYYNYQDQVGCMICDLITECITSGNEALIAALADAIANNPDLRAAINAANAENGGGTPGSPITPEQAAQDTLPENVRDEGGACNLDSLWGAILYLIQSGNRAITDFFEIVESASNTLENMEIVSKAIPAAGNYISAAAGFADQLQEVIAEGYAAAYTETFEEQLACDIFCLAKLDCDLSIDNLMEVINNRLTEPLDLGDFGEIMAGVATGTWVGDDIANVAFLIFFSALRFGQQFLDTIGIRPLTVLMSLGADQLASDNWESLCACLYDWERDYDFTLSEQGWEAIVSPVAQAIWSAGNGWGHGEPTRVGRITLLLDVGYDIDVTYMRVWNTASSLSGDLQQVAIYKNPLYTLVETQAYAPDRTFETDFTANEIVADVEANSDPATNPIDGYLYRIVMRGTGTPPPAL